MITQTDVKSIRQQFADTMLDVGQQDEKLVVLIGDISHFILQPFAQACPDRFYNIGICEPTIVSMAAGLAKVGFVPVVHTIAPFIIERSFEQIKLDFCYHKLGGNLVTVGSAFDYSNLGCTHHCYGDFALFKTLEGTQIVYPASPVEFDTLFKQVYYSNMLTLFRIPTYQHGQTFRPSEIQFGKAVKLIDGSNLTIIATGPQLKNALCAREKLHIHGWDVEIIYIHTILPLDIDLICESVRKTRRVLVIEEHMTRGGLGDDVLRLVHNMGDVQFASLSIPDTFVRSYGHYEDHCEAFGFTPEGIVDKVLLSYRNYSEIRS